MSEERHQQRQQRLKEQVDTNCFDSGCEVGNRNASTSRG